MKINRCPFENEIRARLGLPPLPHQMNSLGADGKAAAEKEARRAASLMGWETRRGKRKILSRIYETSPMRAYHEEKS